MNHITQGHWLFAGVVLLSFVVAMVFAYRRDLKKVGGHYKRVWLVVIGIAVIYFLILFLNRVL